MWDVNETCYTTPTFNFSFSHCSFSSFSSPSLHLTIHSSLHVFSTSLNIFTQNSVSFLCNVKWVKIEGISLYDSTPMKATLLHYDSASSRFIYLFNLHFSRWSNIHLTTTWNCLPLSLTSSEIVSASLSHYNRRDKARLQREIPLPCYQLQEGFQQHCLDFLNQQAPILRSRK